MVGPPANDAFNFGTPLSLKYLSKFSYVAGTAVVSLKTYLEVTFHFALAIGLYIVRCRSS